MESTGLSTRLAELGCLKDIKRIRKVVILANRSHFVNLEMLLDIIIFLVQKNMTTMLVNV